MQIDPLWSLSQQSTRHISNGSLAILLRFGKFILFSQVSFQGFPWKVMRMNYWKPSFGMMSLDSFLSIFEKVSSQMSTLTQWVYQIFSHRLENIILLYHYQPLWMWDSHLGKQRLAGYLHQTPPYPFTFIINCMRLFHIAKLGWAPIAKSQFTKVKPLPLKLSQSFGTNWQVSLPPLSLLSSSFTSSVCVNKTRSYHHP